MAHLLLVDDEVMITQTLTTLIEMMSNIKVISVNDPQDVLQTDLLDRQTFDMVISDFMMPKINGIELLQAIQKKQPKIVPILLTGYSDKNNAIKSINEVGLYYYLEKPWDNNELIKVIENGMEKKRLQEEVHQKMDIIESRNLEISRLYNLLKRDFNQELNNTVEVVVALANLIEAKDSYTDGHTRRVADLSAELGRRAQLSPKQIQVLEIAAIIHDIGKVGTPEAILNKPSKLEAYEFDTIKEHPQLGANIIRPLTALEPCLDVVLHHHEKLDGSGYPHGLKGEAISIETRIVAVADIFDALYSDRPYRKRMPLDQALGILQADAEKGLLDPSITALLMAMAKEGVLETYYQD